MLIFATASSGLGQTVIQDFESGLPVGSTTGDASIKGTFEGIAPPQGSGQLLLTTINQTNDSQTPQAGAGNDAVAVASVASFVGTTTGTLKFDATNTGQEGSAFKVVLSLQVGDVLSFNWDFLTSEDPTGSPATQDFGFASLVRTGSLVNYTVLGHTTTATNSISPSPFFDQTGFSLYQFTITQAGTYTLGIGVMDAKATDGPSGLLVDNIVVTPAPVPEPSTVGLGLAGAVLLVALRKRIKRA